MTSSSPIPLKDQKEKQVFLTEVISFGAAFACDYSILTGKLSLTSSFYLTLELGVLFRLVA
jgi:hypothetical protein